MVVSEGENAYRMHGYVPRIHTRETGRRSSTQVGHTGELPYVPEWSTKGGVFSRRRREPVLVPVVELRVEATPELSCRGAEMMQVQAVENLRRNLSGMSHTTGYGRCSPRSDEILRLSSGQANT